jgi:hypothetical protein
MVTRRRKRVKLHLVEDPGQQLPSIEGLLLSRSGGEYTLAVPQLHVAVGANPVTPEGRLVVVPRQRVAFYEVL